MGLYFRTVAAATAVVGYDLFDNMEWQVSNKARRISRIGLTGSDAVDACIVGIYFGGEKVAQLIPSKVGAIADAWVNNEQMFWVSDKRICRPGVPIKAVVEDAPATNPINIAIDLT